MIINIVDCDLLNAVSQQQVGAPGQDHGVEALPATQPSAPHTIHPWHTCHTNKFSGENNYK